MLDFCSKTGGYVRTLKHFFVNNGIALAIVFLVNSNEGKTYCELVKFSKMCTNRYPQMFSNGIMRKVSQCYPGSLTIEKASRAIKWDHGTFPGPK